jgi:hypothetical protein
MAHRAKSFRFFFALSPRRFIPPRNRTDKAVARQQFQLYVAQQNNPTVLTNPRWEMLFERDGTVKIIDIYAILA